jgi:hypothetical protein
MSAGLPGLGLGGLFFILSALLAPFLELVRTVQGRSSRRAWAQVGRQFGLALTMIVAVDLTLRAVYAAIAAGGIRQTPSSSSATVLPMAPIVITAGVLAIVLLSAKGMQLTSRARSAGLALPAPWPSRSRVLAGAATLTVAWFALLLAGASQLSTLSGGTGGTEAQALPRDELASVATDDAIAEAPSGVKGKTGPGSPSSSETEERLEVPSNAAASGPSDAWESGVAGNVVALESGSAPGETQPSDLGQTVSVESQGEGQAAAGSGPPPSAGPPDRAGSSESAGPPEHAGPPEGGGSPAAAGPPEHLGLPVTVVGPAHAASSAHAATGALPGRGLGRN